MEQQVGVSLESLVRTLAQSARIVGPREQTISAITVDSREANPGALFVALRGEHTDGHRFVADAVAHGCTAIALESLSSDLPANVTAIVVPDTARALSQLDDAFLV
jgi:UDP-N-acetylmuramoyl-L-alanyl-D-glutamate--2,6-diaminopimelate ligase